MNRILDENLPRLLDNSQSDLRHIDSNAMIIAVN